MQAEKIAKLPASGTSRLQRAIIATQRFLRAYWLGTVILLFATTVFLWPMLSRAGSYSAGGDAMFNSWTLARDQNCILRHNCPHFVDGNIFFPNKDSMVYSETQLSAGLLTLPLRLINNNPVFTYSIWTVVSFFLGGWFMYLLAKFLNRGHEFFAVLSGLIFEFGPYKLQSFVHLQNLSIFYLPLIVLLVLKYLKNPGRKLLGLLFVALVLQFYASWYQMAYVLLALAALLITFALTKLHAKRPLLLIAAVTVLAVIATLPLAREYARFSKATNASFGIAGQAQFSASLMDYVIPAHGTLAGTVFHAVLPGVPLNSYNTDSSSYHGVVLYVIGLFVLIVSFRRRKRDKDMRTLHKLSLAFWMVMLGGFIVSLGPLLKLGSSAIRAINYNGKLVYFALPLPYIIVSVLVPQLSFMRALGRATVLVQFGLCCLVALLPIVLAKTKLGQQKYRLVTAFICMLIVFELFPFHLVPMSNNPAYYRLTIPKAYTYIRDHTEVDNLVVLAADSDYYGNYQDGVSVRDTTYEQVLWAGYDNKNTFNGYSGYIPPHYVKDLDDFIDFHPDDVVKMKHLGIRYVLVDKTRSKSRPDLSGRVAAAASSEPYNDSHFSLYKL